MIERIDPYDRAPTAVAADARAERENIFDRTTVAGEGLALKRVK